jgi:hypothetical protein
MRWHRELVATKWNHSQPRGPGLPRIMKMIVDLILRMALESRSWGYTRIRGALANLGHQVGRGTIANIRSVHIAGITLHPDNRWVTQISRNVTDVEEA